MPASRAKKERRPAVGQRAPGARYEQVDFFGHIKVCDDHSQNCQAAGQVQSHDTWGPSKILQPGSEACLGMRGSYRIFALFDGRHKLNLIVDFVCDL